jgi:hypothetical protein
MSGSLARLPRLPLLAAGCTVAVCSVAGCAVPGRPAPQPSRTPAASAMPVPPRLHPSPRPTVPATVVPAIGGDPAHLAGQLTAAETILAQSDASPAAIARQALTVELACLRLALHPRWAGPVISQVAPARRAAAAADIAGAADLVALTAPRTRLPPWQIVPAATLAALRASYRAAQAATGVGWSYLAAINFVETDFGRITGPSSAGAQGPMQFLPATWAIYGHGDIYRPRDAIMAAARFLADHGALRDITSALFAYNPSWRYVDAVVRYATRLRADPRALRGYYSRSVIFRLDSGWVLLPPGYGISPAARPIWLRL